MSFIRGYSLTEVEQQLAEIAIADLYPRFNFNIAASYINSSGRVQTYLGGTLRFCYVILISEEQNFKFAKQIFDRDPQKISECVTSLIHRVRNTRTDSQLNDQILRKLIKACCRSVNVFLERAGATDYQLDKSLYKDRILPSDFDDLYQEQSDMPTPAAADESSQEES